MCPSLFRLRAARLPAKSYPQRQTGTRGKKQMRAVGYKRSLPIENRESLLDLEIDKPTPQGRDLLVQVKAVSVNPVDYKVRKRAEPKDGEPPKILGYDATGGAAASGPAVTPVKPGDGARDAR